MKAWGLTWLRAPLNVSGARFEPQLGPNSAYTNILISSQRVNKTTKASTCITSRYKSSMAISYTLYETNCANKMRVMVDGTLLLVTVLSKQL